MQLRYLFLHQIDRAWCTDSLLPTSNATKNWSHKLIECIFSRSTCRGNVRRRNLSLPADLYMM